MLREIINRLAGRKKVADEPVDFSAVQKLLAGLNVETKITINYIPFKEDYEDMKFSNVTPKDTAEFVKDEFKPLSLKYFEANHQIFSGEKDERHYIDLRRGYIRVSIGIHEFRNLPDKKATLSYILQK